MDVKLDPALQDKCLIDLGKWCSEKTETGQVGGKATCLSRGDNSNAGPDEHLRGLGTVKSISTDFTEGFVMLFTVLSIRNPEENVPFGLCNCTSPKQLV